MLRKTFLLTVAVLILGHASPSRAGITVEIESLAINPGGSSNFVNVWIRSENPDTPVSLSSFGFELLIRASSGTNSFLSFVDPQPDPQLYDPAFQPLYVFANDSVNAVDNAPMGTVLQTEYPRDTFIGGDDSVSGEAIIAMPRLLARLELVSGPLPLEIGDTFELSLKPDESTFFLDPNFNEIDFRSITGTVTVVPEPSSLVLVLSCLPIVALAGRRAWSLRSTS